MLAISENVLFPGHNYLLTSSINGLTLIIARSPARVIIKVKGHQYLEIGHFLEVASMVVVWWIVAFCVVMFQQLQCLRADLE